MVNTTNTERLKKYKSKMEAAGFKRIAVYAHPDLVNMLKKERKSNECGGRTLERLLLGEARARPHY